MLALIYFVSVRLSGILFAGVFTSFGVVRTPASQQSSRAYWVCSWFTQSGGVGFLLDPTTPFVGQSPILCSGHCGSVLA